MKPVKLYSVLWFFFQLHLYINKYNHQCVISYEVKTCELTFSPVIQYVQQPQHQDLVSFSTYPCLSYRCWARLAVDTQRNIDCKTKRLLGKKIFDGKTAISNFYLHIIKIILGGYNFFCFGFLSVCLSVCICLYVRVTNFIN